MYILACSCRFHRQCSTAAQQCSYSWQFVREFTWSPVSHVVSPELHLECTWKPLEAHLESTWSPPGDHLWTTWSPLGFQGCTKGARSTVLQASLSLLEAHVEALEATWKPLAGYLGSREAPKAPRRAKSSQTVRVSMVLQVLQATQRALGAAWRPF